MKFISKISRSELVRLSVVQRGADQFSSSLPSDNFYQKSRVEPYIQFAKNNNMFAIWSDPHWSQVLAAVDNGWTDSPPQTGYEAELQQLIDTYPKTIITDFANNDGSNVDIPLQNSWSNYFQSFMQSGNAIGYGLSDQSWMCNSVAYPYRFMLRFP